MRHELTWVISRLNFVANPNPCVEQLTTNGKVSLHDGRLFKAWWGQLPLRKILGCGKGLIVQKILLVNTIFWA